MRDLEQAAGRVQEGGTERPLEGHSCGASKPDACDFLLNPKQVKKWH